MIQTLIHVYYYYYYNTILLLRSYPSSSSCGIVQGCESKLELFLLFTASLKPG